MCQCDLAFESKKLQYLPCFILFKNKEISWKMKKNAQTAQS
ncbi:hypothetical protein VCSRO8_3099 [Vibrio cholerae]|nr:hypothetical protein VCSRO8_3099 [Vibrio cholerae]